MGPVGVVRNSGYAQCGFAEYQSVNALGLVGSCVSAPLVRPPSGLMMWTCPPVAKGVVRGSAQGVLLIVPFTAGEVRRRADLAAYLDKCSEDKALEYGKGIGMRYMLPTRHFLYFGIQVKGGYRSGLRRLAVVVVCLGAVLVGVPVSLFVGAAGVCSEGCRVAGSVARRSAATPADVMRARAETEINLPASLVALWSVRDGLLTESGVAVYSAKDIGERNAAYEVAQYAPGFLLVGDDSGGRGFLRARLPA